MLRLQRALIICMAAALGASAAAAQSPDRSFGSPMRFTQEGGEALYRSICQACHMPAGQGAIGAGRFPALAKNDKLASGDYAVYVVVNGQKGMPGLGRFLDDDQVAAVVNYVRTQFGNDYRDKVSADDVKRVR